METRRNAVECDEIQPWKAASGRLASITPMDDSHLYLETSNLVSRGWTRGLVERFLGQPDRWLPVNHWANYQGKRAYFLERVQQVEASDSFQKAFERSLRRGRRVSQEQLAEFLRGRCTNLSVICSLDASSQPLRGRWSDGERSEPSATDPAGVGIAKIVANGGPRRGRIGVFDKKHPHPPNRDPLRKS